MASPESQANLSFISTLFIGAITGHPLNVNASNGDDVFAEGFIQFSGYDWYTLMGQVSNGVASTPGGIPPKFLEWLVWKVCPDGTVSPNPCPNPYQPDVLFTDNPW